MYGYENENLKNYEFNFTSSFFVAHTFNFALFYGGQMSNTPRGCEDNSWTRFSGIGLMKGLWETLISFSH